MGPQGLPQAAQLQQEAQVREPERAERRWTQARSFGGRFSGGLTVRFDFGFSGRFTASATVLEMLAETFSATGRSMELEWVFFSATPSSAK